MDTSGSFTQNQFCSYEIALKLKELGFNELCFGFYYNENNFEIAIPDVVKVICDKFNYIKAPLWQQVTTWFRNKYKISIEINLIDNCIEYYYEYSIVCSNNRQYYDGEMLDQAEILYNDLKFKSYEEAREAAIWKVLELLKVNKEKYGNI